MSVKHRSFGMFAAALLFVAFSSLSLLHAAVKTSKSDVEKSRFYINSASKLSAAENTYMYSRMMFSAWNIDSTNEYLRFIRGENTMDYGKGEALEMMRPYYEKNKDDILTVSAYINVLLENNKDAEAYEILDRLIEVRPENLDLRQLEVALAVTTDSLDRAYRALDISASLGMDDADVLQRKLAIMTEGEEIDSVKVLSLLSDYMDKHPDDDNFFEHYVAINDLLDKKDEAYKLVNERIKTYPENANARLTLARLQYSDDNINGVYNTLADIMEVPAFQNEGFSEGFFDVITDIQNDTILRLTDVMMQKLPVSDVTKQKYIIFKTTMREYDKVDSMLNANPGLSLFPEGVGYAVIMSQLASGKPGKALETYNKMAEKGVSPEFTAALLPSVYNMLRDEEKYMDIRTSLLKQYLPGLTDYDNLPALAYWDMYDETDIEDASRLYKMEAELYNNKGDVEKTLRAARNSVALNPYDAEALNNYAYFISESTDDPAKLEDAHKMIQSAIRQAWDLNKFDTLAWILFKQKRYDTAEKLMEKVIENLDGSESSREDFMEHMADIYSMNGKKEKAVEIWKEVYEKDPSRANVAAKIEAGKYIPAQ